MNKDKKMILGYIVGGSLVIIFSVPDIFIWHRNELMLVKTKCLIHQTLNKNNYERKKIIYCVLGYFNFVLNK